MNLLRVLVTLVMQSLSPSATPTYEREPNVTTLTTLTEDTAPPFEKALAVTMFNATMPANAFVVPGDQFYKEELKWNKTQLAKFEVKAMAYFREKFGLRIPDERLYGFLYSTNPEANTRCVVLSEETDMPKDGYKLLDGGWMITVIAPNGITLGGEFAGLHVPVGTTFAIGQWLIVRPNKANIQWDFQHNAPGIIATPRQGRISHGEMQVTGSKWGTGLSLQLAKYTISANKSATALFRNVITF